MNCKRYINNFIKDGHKTFIVLGATSGIGLEASKILLSKGHQVIMGARNLNKAYSCKKKILEIYKDADIKIEYYDQSSFQCITNFIHIIKTKYPHFDGLVFNAGIFHTQKNLYSVDNFPLVMATNFYGPLFFIHSFLDFLMNKKEETRIIFVSSLSSRWITYSDDLLDKYSWKDKEYFASKYALTNLFYYLVQNNKNSLIKYLYVEPGVAKTDIIRNYNNFIKSLASIFMPIFSNSILKSSLGICYLLTNDDIYNGLALAPKHFFHFKGYPIKINLKDKTIKYNARLIKKAIEKIKV